ncbi:MAG: tetratricopeptide repeat protein, partial [Bacteroidota bacterium]
MRQKFIKFFIFFLILFSIYGCATEDQHTKMDSPEEKSKIEMIQGLTKAIELDPKYVSAYYNRGIVYGKQGKFPQAIQDNTKAIELEPKHVNAYNNRGVAYDNQGNYTQAIHDYNKAIELDPKYVNAYHNRGLVCEK